MARAVTEALVADLYAVAAAVLITGVFALNS